MDELPPVCELLPQLREAHPAFLLRLFLGADLELLLLGVQVDVGVSDDVLAVLAIGLRVRIPRPRCSRSAGGAGRPWACPSGRRIVRRF